MRSYLPSRKQFLITLVIVMMALVGLNVLAYMLDSGTQTFFHRVMIWIGKNSVYPAVLLLKIKPIVYPNLWIYIGITLLNSLVYISLIWALIIAFKVKFNSSITSV